MRPPGLIILWFASLGTPAGTAEDSAVSRASPCERASLAADNALTFSLKAAISPRGEFSEASNVSVRLELVDALTDVRELACCLSLARKP